MVDGKRYYLGPWHGEKKPPMAVALAYHAAIREMVGAVSVGIPVLAGVGEAITCIEAANLFISHQLKTFGPRAEASAEFSLRNVVLLFGRFAAKDFGPVRLAAVRDHLVQIGRTRSGINCQVNRIRRCWRWLASMEMLPSSVVEGHRTLRGLRFGQTTAGEAKPKATVTADMAEGTARAACPVIAGMIRVQLLTGVRPGEVCRMVSGDIDQTQSVWFYRPSHHKNAWRGNARSVPIGPKCQAILLPFLQLDEPDKPLFSPKDSMAWHQKEKRSRRKSRVQPSQVDRSIADPERTPGDAYDTQSFGRAIKYLQIRQGLARWSPSCLRATRAQTIFESFGIDAARTILGHSDEKVTLRYYTQENEAKAASLAVQVG